MRVNLITGPGGVNWVFKDLVGRLAQVPVEFVVTERPLDSADVLHFYRPQAAVAVEDLSRAVLTNHGFGHRGVPPVQMYGPDVVAAFKRAARTITLNSIDEGILREAGIADGQMARIPHPVDPDMFTLRPPHEPHEKLCIGRVGRPYGAPDCPRTGLENKGAATLQEVMQELAPEADAIRWLFVGAGWESVVGQARELGYEADYVQRTEDNYPEAFVAAYHEMDVYLVTSRSEGGPASLPEAMACGVWPVCTDVGMCHDLLPADYSVPGTGGYCSGFGNLVAVNDTRALLVALRERMYAKRRGTLDVLRHAMRARVKRWTWREWGKAHNDVYHAVAGQAP